MIACVYVSRNRRAPSPPMSRDADVGIRSLRAGPKARAHNKKIWHGALDSTGSSADFSEGKALDLASDDSSENRQEAGGENYHDPVLVKNLIARTFPFL